MQSVTGGGPPARLWARFMARALEDQAPQPLAGGDVEIAVSDQLGDFLDQLVRRLTGASASRSSGESGSSGASFPSKRKND